MPSPPSVEEVADDIRRLRIQGARRIARAALDALAHVAIQSKAKTTSELYDELLAAARKLEATRPTEPMMRNALEDALRAALAFCKHHPSNDVKALKQALAQQEQLMLRHMDQSAQKIAEYGARQLPQGAHVLVHCHSSTLVAILKRAQADGKHPRVTCLETRPLMQGRLTARELAEAGIETELAVDSAAGSLISKADVVLVGADAITAEGDLVNKIGTHTIAQLAFAHAVPFWCAAELYKYDPLTRFGRAEPIEQRDASEVWGDGKYAQEKKNAEGMEALPVPPHLRILNPAFDRTPSRLIATYITEAGLCPPGQLALWAQRLKSGETALQTPEKTAGAKPGQSKPKSSSKSR